VDNALYAIADYFSIGGLNKSTVSVESVENFLKEKNLTELLFKLKRAYANSAKKKVDIDDIRKVLYSTLSVDSPFVEETNNNEIPVSEKYFENPLKEDFITAEHLTENEELDERENELDINKELGLEEFVGEEKTSKNLLTDEVTNEKSLEILEELVAISEPEKFKINDDIQNSESNSGDSKDIVITDLDLYNEVTETELSISDQNSVEESESLLKESIDEEDVLESLTDEIGKDKDDEIIILDEKEQEDLLNFYDNELEISIDDDLPISKSAESNPNLDISGQLDDLEFEHESITDGDKDDEVPLEKIDFKKDLLGVEESKSGGNLNEESLTELDSKKRSDDVFTYLSKKEIDRIIKNLFNSDSEDFANTVEKMALCNTYEEASIILENVFKYARIKPHSRDAASLTTAVAKYFNVEK
jgi:hypothetical protein